MGDYVKVVILAALLIVTEAHAQTDVVMVLSIGSDECAKFVSADHVGREMYLGWTLGFMTGANFGNLGGSRVGGAGWKRESALLWLDNYCRANPLENYVTASLKYREELLSRTPK